MVCADDLFISGDSADFSRETSLPTSLAGSTVSSGVTFGTKQIEHRFQQKMERTYIKCPRSLDELIASLHVLFEDDKVNIEDVKEVMENYTSNEEEWGKYAIYDNHR